MAPLACRDFSSVDLLSSSSDLAATFSKTFAAMQLGVQSGTSDADDLVDAFTKIIAGLIGSTANNLTLYGDNGNDRLLGSGGNDVLIGGTGGDLLSGGAGVDTASYATAQSAVTASLQAPNANRGDAASDSSTRSRISLGPPFRTR